MWSRMFPDVCDIFFRPSGAGCVFRARSHALRRGLHFFRRFAAAFVVSASLKYFQCAFVARSHGRGRYRFCEGKSADAVIDATDAKSWFQIGTKNAPAPEERKNAPHSASYGW